MNLPSHLSIIFGDVGVTSPSHLSLIFTGELVFECMGVNSRKGEFFSV